MKQTTIHAKARIKDRQNEVINSQNKSLIKNVKKNGITYLKYIHKNPDTKLSKYLIKRRIRYNNTNLFLYKSYVFVFTKGYNKLITTYPLPLKLALEFEAYISKREKDTI